MSDSAPNSSTQYPVPLQEIIELFEMLPEQERRENLVLYSESAGKCAPSEGEMFDLEDVRKDEECTDEVGVFLRIDDQNRAKFKITLGPQVQTLTKAMTAILSRGLSGQNAQVIADLPADFVPRIIGAELVRLRSQTVYYVLGRIKGAIKVLQSRRRAAS